jgi:hypothetical protein
VAREKIACHTGSSYTDFWAKQAAWNNYGSVASIIARSVYSRAEDFLRCGYLSFSCRDRLFCPWCCFNFLARPGLDEFGDSIGADNEVHYLVLSLSSNPDEKQRLIFRDIDESDIHNIKRPATEEDMPHDYGIEFQTDGDLRDCRILWLFYNEVIREFTGNRNGCKFSGAIGGPELAVRFQPLRVLPHANYIVWSPGLSADGIRALRKFIRQKMRDCRPLQTMLYPSVACCRIRLGDDLRRVIKYIFKPIDVASAYSITVDRIQHDPAAVAQLNFETNEFLKNVLDVSWHSFRSNFKLASNLFVSKTLDKRQKLLIVVQATFWIL